MDDAVLADVVDREKRLLDPTCRADEASLHELLHPDFLEFGASGRVWTFDDVLSRLPTSPGLAGTGQEFVAHRMTDDVVLVTFRLTGPNPSLRSSLWVRCDDDHWRLRFHQGTPSST